MTVSEPTYLSVLDVHALHDEIMERTGFAPAPLRDEGLLKSALMRPQMAAHYEQADLIKQAALLAIGISQAQAFLDGNKRAAFAACRAFLWLNGLTYNGDPLELAKQLEAVATREGTLEEASDRFEAWLRSNVIERE
jgi:death on curing protein